MAYKDLSLYEKVAFFPLAKKKEKNKYVKWMKTNYRDVQTLTIFKEDKETIHGFNIFIKQ